GGHALRVWNPVTLTAGLLFVRRVAYAGEELVAAGVPLQAGVSGAVAAVVTARSGFNAAVGTLDSADTVLRTARAACGRGWTGAARAVSYDWHFVDVIWIGVFVVIYLVQ